MCVCVCVSYLDSDYFRIMVLVYIRDLWILLRSLGTTVADLAKLEGHSELVSDCAWQPADSDEARESSGEHS